MSRLRSRFRWAGIVVAAALLAACGGGGGGDPVYAISGTITGATEVTVTLTGGAAPVTTTTTTDGSYNFAGLANGSYTATPSKAGATFNPPSSAVTINGANAADINFAATYAITGTVTGASEVTITLTGGSAPVTATTSSDGSYSFAGFANGSYTATPSKEGFTFNPQNSAVTIDGAIVANINFTAAAVVVPGPPTPLTGTIRGVVASNASGLPVVGATVTVGTNIATTGADGSYVLTGVAVTTRTVVNVNANNYLMGSKVTSVFAGDTNRVDVTLLLANTATLTSLSTVQTVTVPNSSATIMLPTNGLQTNTGATVSGNIIVSVTPVDPSSNPQIMPGDYVTSDGGLLESLGALNVSIHDAIGAALFPASGSSFIIRIPVAAARRANPPTTIDLWYYSAATGQWIQEGTLTLGGTAPNQYYEGTITRFSLWSANQRYTSTCVTGKVLDAGGNPVSNARVDSEGQGYAGISTAYSAADGSFTLQIKANASVILTAKTTNAQSNSEVVQGGAAGTTCTPMGTDLRLGSTVVGSAKIKLTWGENPDDLDSHLTGPVEGSATRFHVYFGSKGSQAAAPYAELDVDDTSSFGPEIITINRFTPGLYRYSVHHYSGSSTIPSCGWCWN
ncbi:MAG: hypothetical protein FD130_750 [Halothiobacillaceae bacterium]|nr:MAG: hypothetical protein FD130_750 [Halothiobacillaceae bacterium]